MASAAALLLLGVVSLFLFNLKESERKLRLQTQVQLDEKLTELTMTKAQVDKLLKEKADLETTLTGRIQELETQVAHFDQSTLTLHDTIDLLSKDKDSLEYETALKEKTIAELAKKVHSLEMDKIELMNKLKSLETPPESSPSASGDAAQTAALAEKEAAGQAAGAVKLGKIVVQKQTGSAARVEHVNPVYGFIIVTAGSQDGLKKDSIIQIIRDSRPIGKAVVQKTRPHISAALVLPEWTQEPIQVGDLVATFS